MAASPFTSPLPIPSSPPAPLVPMSNELSQALQSPSSSSSSTGAAFTSSSDDLGEEDESTSWQRVMSLLQEHPELLSRSILCLALKHRPPVEIVAYILQVHPEAAMPCTTPSPESNDDDASDIDVTPLQIALEYHCGVAIIQELLMAYPRVLETPFVPCHTTTYNHDDRVAMNALTYARLYRGNEPELLKLLSHPVSSWCVPPVVTSRTSILTPEPSPPTLLISGSSSSYMIESDDEDSASTVATSNRHSRVDESANAVGNGGGINNGDPTLMILPSESTRDDSPSPPRVSSTSTTPLPLRTSGLQLPSFFACSNPPPSATHSPKTKPYPLVSSSSRTHTRTLVPRGSTSGSGHSNYYHHHHHHRDRGGDRDREKVDVQELRNVKQLCAAVVKGQRKLSERVNVEWPDYLETKLAESLRVCLIAAEMKEQVVRASVQRVQTMVSEQVRECLEQVQKLVTRLDGNVEDRLNYLEDQWWDFSAFQTSHNDMSLRLCGRWSDDEMDTTPAAVVEVESRAIIAKTGNGSRRTTSTSLSETSPSSADSMSVSSLLSSTLAPTQTRASWMIRRDKRMGVPAHPPIPIIYSSCLFSPRSHGEGFVDEHDNRDDARSLLSETEVVVYPLKKSHGHSSIQCHHQSWRFRRHKLYRISHGHTCLTTPRWMEKFKQHYFS